MIKIDLKVGDTVLTGKWKNKKVVVKDIGTDEFGSPTVNGKSILKIRIPKFYQKESAMKNIKEDLGRTPLNVREFEQQVVKPKLKKYRSSIQFDDSDYSNLSKEYEDLYKNKWKQINLPGQHSQQSAKISSDNKVIKGTAYHDGGIIGVLYIKENILKLKDLIKEDSITITNFANKEKKQLTVGDDVRWLQRGLNRYLKGKIVSFVKSEKNPNESGVEIKLDNGKTVKTKAWQLL